MDTEYSKKIISDNYYGEEGSFVDSLYNDSFFSYEKFWEYYDSIVCLTKNSIKDDELTEHISISYQRILKEMLYHFSPFDVARICDFPENYNDYIERLDFAVLAYFRGDLKWLDDERFELQR